MPFKFRFALFIFNFRKFFTHLNRFELVKTLIFLTILVVSIWTERLTNIFNSKCTAFNSKGSPLLHIHTRTHTNSNRSTYMYAYSNGDSLSFSVLHRHLILTFPLKYKHLILCVFFSRSPTNHLTIYQNNAI